MQTRESELQAQQLVLAFLGFYRGRIDGIWSDASIKAKQAFEMSEQFVPAQPNNGLPFTAGCRLPKKLRWERGYLTHANLTNEKIKEILDRQAPKPMPVAEKKEQVKPAPTEVKAEVKPAVVQKTSTNPNHAKPTQNVKA